MAFVMALSLWLTGIPANTVSAATEASVQTKSSVSESTIYTDQSVKVTLTIQGIPGTGTVVPTDIVLILDQSGSMGGTKINTLKTAAIEFINKINYKYHRVGLISYSSSVEKNVSFTSDVTELTDAINTITATGGTYIGTAIDAANVMLEKDMRSGAKPVIVIVTDGEAADTAKAMEAAEKAKKNGFIFYTIALFEDAGNAEISGTTEYRANELLKSMATTAVHHHFVGETGLTQAYRDIAGDVGVENPYSVKITQTLSDAFAYVEGSADSNIPQPTIVDNTLTWEMLELKDQTLKLTYKIAPTGMTGKFPVTSLGTVEYTTYAGNQKTVEITPKNITVKAIPDLENVTMSPTSGVEGKRVTVKVKADGLYYGSGFKVMLGDQEMELTAQETTFFKFSTPKDLAVGTYDVTVYNGDGSKGVVIGQYECYEFPGIIVTNMTPLNVDEGKSTTITATLQEAPEYKSDFKVTVGGVEAAIKSRGTETIVFKVPKTLAPGEYDVVITNGGRSTTVKDKITVAEKVTPVLVLTDPTPTTMTAGKAATVTLQVDCGGVTPDYKSDFAIMVGDVEAAVKSRGKDTVVIKVPKTLSAGTYPITFTNDGTTSAVRLSGGGDAAMYVQAAVEKPLIAGVVSMTPTVAAKNSTVITITLSAAATVKSDFKILVGGVEARLKSIEGSTIKFKRPLNMAAGSYTVEIYNGGITTPVGTLTIQ